MKNIVFIIGAARSGTKILRDVISTHPHIDKVPYDINFIWRLTNESLEHDKLIPAEFNEEAHKMINKYLNKYLKNESNYLVEKTVSNTIRIPFLLKHYPNAKFIFLYRNGLDVCESVIRQWNDKPKQDYLLKKLKHIPFKVLLSYGVKFVLRHLNVKRFNYYWGVNYPGMKDDLSKLSIEEIVAHQWKNCVGEMRSSKKLIQKDNLIEIFYEDFVLDKEKTFKKIIEFIDLEFTINDLDLGTIKQSNIGKSRNALSKVQFENISNIIQDEMKELNYLTHSS